MNKFKNKTHIFIHTSPQSTAHKRHTHTPHHIVFAISFKVKTNFDVNYKWSRENEKKILYGFGYVTKKKTQNSN